MKIELNRLEFLKAWQIAEHSTNAKSTNAAAAGILITAGDNVTTLEATDFKTAVRCTASGVEVVTPGSAVLPVRLLGEILKRLPTETATLEVNGERGTLAAGRSRTRFTTPPVSEFPDIPRSNSAETICSILAADLARVIAEGSIASATPAEFPKYLGTCLFKIKENILKGVSTDGRRLSLSQCPCDTNAETAGKGDEELLLPITALKELGRLLAGEDQESHIKISSDGSTAWFFLENIEFSIRRVESSFPNYEKILTSDVLTTLQIPKEELLPALERIDIIARNTISHLVVMRLTPGEGLRLTARAPDMGTASEVLDATVDGRPLHVGFNVGYFQDGLKALRAGDTLVEFNGEEGQTRITQAGTQGSEFLYMLMPARLSPQDLLEEEDENA